MGCFTTQIGQTNGRDLSDEFQDAVMVVQLKERFIEPDLKDLTKKARVKMTGAFRCYPHHNVAKVTLDILRTVNLV